MRRNGYLWISGVNLDTAVYSSTPISYKTAKFRRFGDVFRWLLHFIFWMSATFLLPVCFTYWPRKYTTRVNPHVDNSHQVWSWYVHTLPSYSIFVCWYFMWPWPLTSWPWQLQCMAGHVTNFDLWGITFPIGYHWKCVRGHWACAKSHDLWVGGQKQLHFWNPRHRFAYSLYNFSGSTMSYCSCSRRRRFTVLDFKSWV